MKFVSATKLLPVKRGSLREAKGGNLFGSMMLAGKVSPFHARTRSA